MRDYQKQREESQKTSLKVVVYSALILACLIIGLNIYKLF